MACPGNWKRGLKPAVPWFNFDPSSYPKERLRATSSTHALGRRGVARVARRASAQVSREGWELDIGFGLARFGCGSKPMGSHFGVGAPPILEPPILEPTLVGIGMFTTGVRAFDPWPFPLLSLLPIGELD